MYLVHKNLADIFFDKYKRSNPDDSTVRMVREICAVRTQTTLQSEWLGKFAQSELQTTIQSKWLGKFAPHGLGGRVNIPPELLKVRSATDP